MPLIHLSSKQRKSYPLTSGIEWPERVSTDKLPGLIKELLAGSETARDTLIEGHLYLVPWIVGRYLYHWPLTRRFEDDMVGEASLAIVEGITEFTGKDSPEWLVSVLVGRIRNRIEVFLNDNQEIISASISTNKRRMSNEQELVYVPSRPLNDNDGAYEDENYALVDLQDLLSVLAEADNEEIVTAVLRIMEGEYGVSPENLTPTQTKLINELSRF